MNGIVKDVRPGFFDWVANKWGGASKLQRRRSLVMQQPSNPNPNPNTLQNTAVTKSQMKDEKESGSGMTQLIETYLCTFPPNFAWPRSTDTKVLAKGSSAQIFALHSKSTDDKRPFVLKQIRITEAEWKGERHGLGIEDFARESFFLQLLTEHTIHPDIAIPALYCRPFCVDASGHGRAPSCTSEHNSDRDVYGCVIMERCACNLGEWGSRRALELGLTRKPNGQPVLLWKHILVMLNIAKALDAVAIVHGDLHLNNFLVRESSRNQKSELVLADWNMAGFADDRPNNPWPPVPGWTFVLQANDRTRYDPGIGRNVPETPIPAWLLPRFNRWQLFMALMHERVVVEMDAKASKNACAQLERLTNKSPLALLIANYLELSGDVLHAAKKYAPNAYVLHPSLYA